MWRKPEFWLLVFLVVGTLVMAMGGTIGAGPYRG